MKNVLTVGLLIGFMTLGIVGSAFAEDSNDISMLGTDEFSFGATVTATDLAVQDHQYNQDHLTNVGTEAGDWQFDFNAPETKADLAAQNYNYDSKKLNMVGTEFGYDAYIHSHGLDCPLC